MFFYATVREHSERKATTQSAFTCSWPFNMGTFSTSWPIGHFLYNKFAVFHTVSTLTTKHMFMTTQRLQNIAWKHKITAPKARKYKVRLSKKGGMKGENVNKRTMCTITSLLLCCGCLCMILKKKCMLLYSDQTEVKERQRASIALKPHLYSVVNLMRYTISAT